VQLKRKHRIRNKLAALSAGLLAASGAAVDAHADDYSSSPYYSNRENDNFGPGVAYSQIDAALLVYEESGGRVQAIEPTFQLSAHSARGAELDFGLVADAVSGATPNGAVPSNQSQTFVTPVKIVTGGESGGSTTVTSASGGSTIVQLPSTPGQVSYSERQYTVAANTLPVDKGFHDHRVGFTFGWSQPLGAISLLGFGGGYSRETDYQSITSNVRIAQTFNANNTTLSLSLNTEIDSSFPYGGVPVPLTSMNGLWKAQTARGKTQLGFVAGVTQVLTRRWLTEIDYSFNRQSGYQNDPYRVISVVDPSSGVPTDTLYENRPNHRQSQSVFWDNKFDLDPFVTDLSVRYFKDSWGITSKTAELSERINLGGSLYAEPSVRWYQQSAANFYHYYLVAGQPLPDYASSDIRLGKFTSLTYGAKVGFNLTNRTELYLRGGYYQQTGDAHPAGAIGQLASQNLFSGTKAAFAFIGYTWDFH
jgi:hypothetical protein